MKQFETYEILTKFRQPLIELIINSLEINLSSKGIDIGCGIGKITKLLANKVGIKGRLTGLDYSAELINYAKANSMHENIEFIQGDINNLNFPSNSFDWIWSMDTLWLGPKTFGCPAEEPDKILNQMYRILKPGGKLFLLFWTSQKLLPGYPLLEARLNASPSANAPNFEEMNPRIHVMNGKKWLKDANFNDVTIRSFVGDLNGPLNETDKRSLAVFYQMFWENSSEYVSKNDWQKYKELCFPGSSRFIANQPDYYGFYTYTLIQGAKSN